MRLYIHISLRQQPILYITHFYDIYQLMFDTYINFISSTLLIWSLIHNNIFLCTLCILYILYIVYNIYSPTGIFKIQAFKYSHKAA